MPRPISSGFAIRPVGFNASAVLEKIGQVRFDILPDAAIEIGVARRNRIDPDHLRPRADRRVFARNE